MSSIVGMITNTQLPKYSTPELHALIESNKSLIAEAKNDRLVALVGLVGLIAMFVITDRVSRSGNKMNKASEDQLGILKYCIVVGALFAFYVAGANHMRIGDYVSNNATAMHIIAGRVSA